MLDLQAFAFSRGAKSLGQGSSTHEVAGGHRAGGHLDMHRGSGTACDAASRHRLGPAATFYSQCHAQFGETQHGWLLTFAPADAVSPQNTRQIMRALHDSLTF